MQTVTLSTDKGKTITKPPKKKRSRAPKSDASKSDATIPPKIPISSPTNNKPTPKHYEKDEKASDQTDVSMDKPSVSGLRSLNVELGVEIITDENEKWLTGKEYSASAIKAFILQTNGNFCF